MGNGQSRDEFAGVLPSATVSGSSKSDPPPISEAWTGEDAVKHPEEDPVATVPPVVVGRIVPPGHALQLEENTSRLSLGASEVVRAFNNVERREERFVIPESVRKSRTLDAYVDVCSEILPEFLYVSNFRVARDTTKLRALGITHVINCCGELKLFEDGVEQPAAAVETEFDVLKLLLRDDANEDLTPFLPQVMEYIATCRQRARSQNEENDEDNKVLVHCHQGVSRSCAFAIAYVMLERRLSYHEASAMVKRHRAISSPNAAFICQLLGWEKDLQAMGSHENGAPAVALGGLYRLAPHSNYDPECLVLKRCYEPSAGSARQRQNIATVQTPDDEHRLLWSQGTFVFQSSTTFTDLIVWHGAQCVIPEAVAAATQLVSQLLRMQALVQRSDAAAVKIIEVYQSSEHTDTDIDLFGYAAELQWSRESAPKMPARLLPTNGDTTKISSNGSDQLEVQATNDVSVPPQLFILEDISEEDGGDSWDQLTNYDSDDLTPDSAFLLYSVKSQGLVQGFMWLGTSCNFTPEVVVKAAQNQIQRLQSLSDSNSTAQLAIERQNQESDAFWQLFEAGY